MTRTTITVEDSQMRDLHQLALERNTSVAALIREAIEVQLESSRRRPRSLGIGASGYSDTSKAAGDHRPVPRDWR